jgi:hypothetical protein
LEELIHLVFGFNREVAFKAWRRVSGVKGGGREMDKGKREP